MWFVVGMPWDVVFGGYVLGGSAMVAAGLERGGEVGYTACQDGVGKHVFSISFFVLAPPDGSSGRRLVCLISLPLIPFPRINPPTPVRFSLFLFLFRRLLYCYRRSSLRTTAARPCR